jgi:hypothetical protein
VLFTIALVLPAWVLGLVGMYNACDRVHVLLLIGLMLRLLAFLRARDAAVRRPAGGPPIDHEPRTIEGRPLHL